MPMDNDRRRFWNTLILIGLFLPFLALAILHYLTNPSRVGAPATAAAASRTQPATVAATPASAPASATAPAATRGQPEAVSLLAAGDGRDLWVMLPVAGEAGPGFQMLRRSANTGVWRPVMRRVDGGGVAGDTEWNAPTPPRALALMPTRIDVQGSSSPYLLGDASKDAAGWAWRFAADGYLPQRSLPARHILKAAVGAPDQLFVVTLGPPVATATRIGDSLRVQQGSAPAPRRRYRAADSAPASTAAPASAPAVEAPAATLLLNVYWLPPTARSSTAPALPAKTLQPAPGDWCLLAALGAPSEDALAVPASSSQIVLAEQNGLLMAFWADAGRGQEIRFRTLDYTNPQQRWSEPRALALAPEEFPNAARLFALTLDKTLYLLWTRPNGASLELRGGWINTDGNPPHAPPAMHLIAPMPLNSAGTGLSVQDVAVGPSENSIVALVNNRDTGLQALVFDDRGHPLAKAAPVVPQGPRRDLQIGQNLALLLLVVMTTLMLWQWRQKQPELALPANTIVAPPHLRAGAFAIDSVIPYAATLLITGAWGEGGYVATLFSWMQLLSSPDDFAKAKELLVFLGLYLTHVTIGEAFFRRSAGKAILGLQVVTLDGKAPTIGAVLVRNIVRLPECFVGVVVVYLLMSPRRQRLGDLLARTVVISTKPAETPGESEKK
jgi:uncharacterized RDD family membrane protein YckC